MREAISCARSGPAESVLRMCTSSGERVSGRGDALEGIEERERISRISCVHVTGEAPTLRRRLAPWERGDRIDPGTANTSRLKSRARRAVIRVPLFSPASTTIVARESPAMIRFRKGKVPGEAGVLGGNSLTRAPLCATIDFARDALFLGAMCFSRRPFPNTATVNPWASSVL